MEPEGFPAADLVDMEARTALVLEDGLPAGNRAALGRSPADTPEVHRVADKRVPDLKIADRDVGSEAAEILEGNLAVPVPVVDTDTAVVDPVEGKAVPAAGMAALVGGKAVPVEGRAVPAADTAAAADVPAADVPAVADVLVAAAPAAAVLAVVDALAVVVAANRPGRPVVRGAHHRLLSAALRSFR
jgi:hypothetical protein